MNWFNAIVLTGIGIILAPALLTGGIAVAGAFVLLWLLFVFGGKHGLEIFKERQSGAAAAKHKSKLSRIGESDDGQRWNR